ncbi:hypothetical protein FJZ53_07080 [Candidatus Woesearchaeota archaeon]|nr:hypothetical protein [Candidatus Woesearchaeota archaeon]
MKIPGTFMPEKDLEEKVIEFSIEKPVKKQNIEETAMIREEYHLELSKKRKNWKTGDHLNRPGTGKTSPKRLIFNSAMMLASMAGAVYLGKEFSDSLPDYILIPYFFGSMFGFPMATYKIISEVMIRYDAWKEYKEKI